jgi:hypothetical protein
MEYGTEIGYKDDNHVRYVGWAESNTDNDQMKEMYTKKNIKKLSKKITQLLHGVDDEERPILVPDDTILSVLSQVRRNYTPLVADMFSPNTCPRMDLENMEAKTIQIIISDVKNNLGTEQQNSKLSIWNSVYGDFNEHGLRQHAPIKINNKHHTKVAGVFNMNY